MTIDPLQLWRDHYVLVQKTSAKQVAIDNKETDQYIDDLLLEIEAKDKLLAQRKRVIDEICSVYSESDSDIDTLRNIESAKKEHNLSDTQAAKMFGCSRKKLLTLRGKIDLNASPAVDSPVVVEPVLVDDSVDILTKQRNQMKIELHKGNCLEVMKSIPDGSVDMILADPPYGTTACKWDSVIDLTLMWEQLKRIIKPNGAIVMTASQPFSSVLGASNLKMLRYSWIWEKAKPTNFTQAKRMPLKGFEEVLVFYSNPPTYNPQGVVRIDKTVKNGGTKAIGRSGMKKNGDAAFHGNIVVKSEKYIQEFTNYPRGIVKFSQDSHGLHPTAKPVALMEYLIKTYTNEGECVLDFTMGSGTTGVACCNLNRAFIGIEMDENYFNIASKRIAEAQENKLKES